MSSIVIAGDTSGTCTLQANAVAGTTTLTLPTTSGTLYAKAGGGAIAVADGGTGTTTSTGTGSVVLNTSPTLVTPALGTPSSGTLTSCTGLPLTTGVTGTLPVANGGTGTSSPSLVAGSGISISGSFPNQTIAATGGGTVTSVATGNGLQGGTITTSGTLSVACPTFNTVGSYAYVAFTSTSSGATGTVTAGSNYSAGTSYPSVRTAFGNEDTSGILNISLGGSVELSGTWKWMSASYSNNGYRYYFGIACRVS